MDAFTSLGLLTCLCIETCIFLHKWNPTCYLLPLSWILLLLLLPSAALGRRIRLWPPRRDQVYLVDFSCLRPPPRLRVPIPSFLEHLSLVNLLDKDSVDFMARVVSSAGQGQETCLPLPLRYIPPKAHLRESLEEAHSLLFPVLRDLLSKTNLPARAIDVLVVNCGGFCPAPSLSSSVASRFRMREDAKTFNLSGMGCSAGAVAVDLASSLLRARSRAGGAAAYAVVLSTEILSTGWYAGKDRRKLLLNCTFRMGSAAVLLTNREERPGTPASSKYRLSRVVRTNLAGDDAAYNAAKLEEDSCGITGFSMERDLMASVRRLVQLNAAAVGRCVLPTHEKARYAAWCVRRALSGMNAGGEEKADYVPGFGKTVQHYCLPSAGRAMVGEIGRGLGLSGEDVEAAVATFHRFGNQSSASLWYQLSYMEGKGRVRRGDRVWQMAAGSGMKCNSVVWECLREMEGEADKGPWHRCIDQYPMAMAMAMQGAL